MTSEQEIGTGGSSARTIGAVVVTALPVEYGAVRQHLVEVREDTHPQGTVYEVGKFQGTNCSWDIAIVEIGAGNTGAAFEAERAIQRFAPSVILFVGVAGGLKDVEIGDVVAATKIYGYESGKSKVKFEGRPDVGSSTYRMEQRARAVSKKSGWLHRLNAPISSRSPQVFVGPIAAGEKVVSSRRSSVWKFLKANYGDALAVEMEGRGFLKATHANQQVDALVIRGISDLVDNKSVADAAGSQETAAQHAAAFAFEVLAELGDASDQVSTREPWSSPYSGESIVPGRNATSSVPLTAMVPMSTVEPVLTIIKDDADLIELVLRGASQRGAILPSVRSAIPSSPSPPEAFIADRIEVGQAVDKLKGILDHNGRPRLILVSPPMTGKSFFLFLLARAWLREGHQVAFFTGGELSPLDQAWLEAQPRALVLVDQDQRGDLRSALVALHRHASAIVLARRPEPVLLADEVLETVYLPHYLDDPRREVAVTCLLAAHDPQFVRHVVQLLAERYKVILSEDGIASVCGLVMGVGQDGTSAGVLGLAKAFFLAARTQVPIGNNNPGLNSEDVGRLAVSLLQDYRDRRAPSQAILTALFSRYPDHLRRLLLVLKFLRFAFGDGANAFCGRTLAVGYEVYFGSHLDEIALEDAVDLGVLNTYRPNLTATPYYAIWHPWQLDVLPDVLSESERKSLLASLTKGLEAVVPAIAGTEDRAAVLFDLAFLYWEDMDSAQVEKAVRSYLACGHAARTGIGQVALTELRGRMLRRISEASTFERATEMLARFLSFMDTGESTAYETIANLLSTLRVTQEHSPTHGATRVQWQEHLERAASQYLAEKPGTSAWLIFYKGITLSRVRAVLRDSADRWLLLFTLATYYRTSTTESDYPVLLSRGVVQSLLEGVGPTGEDALAFTLRFNQIVFSFLSPSQRNEYYANATLYLASIADADPNCRPLLEIWIRGFAEGLERADTSVLRQLHSVCLAVTQEIARDVAQEERLLQAVDELQVSYWDSFEDLSNYYGFALAIVADQQSSAPERLQPLLLVALTQLRERDEAFRQHEYHHLARSVLLQTYTTQCIASVASNLSLPMFANRPVEQRLLSVKCVIDAAVPHIAGDTASLVPFLSMLASSIVGEIQSDETVPFWLPALMEDAEDRLAGRSTDDRFWRSSALADYLGRRLAKAILTSFSGEHQLRSATADEVKRLCGEDRRLRAEVFSRALEQVGLLLITPAMETINGDQPLSTLREVYRFAEQEFPQVNSEANRDVLRVLLATSMVCLAFEAPYYPEGVELVTKALAQVAAENGLGDKRLCNLVERGIADLSRESSDSADTERGLTMFSLVVHERYSPLVQSLLDSCHNIGRDFDAPTSTSSEKTELSTLLAGIREQIRDIRSNLGTFQPRTREIEQFERSMDAYLSEWDWEFNALAQVAINRDQNLLADAMSRWDGERRQLWDVAMDALPPMPPVPSLEQVINDALWPAA